ncbi:MAG: glycoside hydrolase family 43 protein [Candidatus Omnitrophica bacterium]|nr:glycoside hydrolase family 43 protein [Candidatus Omnitrophota bacterium]MBU4488088.1 glycoside hydrolase family 43 protein [Candidatus Omnitrophota bacterium]MCG2705602.1 glycoside hydrolase family 43 protein [Candidatus Omnitrophota bacterium]
MKYKNPVISGFYPDPSVCRVGEDYYLVTSSFEYFPGVPIFHSKDLINWRQIGYCLTRKSQLPLEKARSSSGIFAPTIRHHNGTFYMVTTNANGWRNFFVYSKDPAGDWSEPVWLDQGGIDPSLFFDDDGSVYFASTGVNCIVQSTIDIKTGKQLIDTQEIWRGTSGSYPEGPHLYKINGTYYLMIAEGGTEFGHMETIARSKSPWGPFESCLRNPILTHRSSVEPIQCTGHGDLVEAHNGTWWMVFLGVRTNGHPPCHHIGREVYLAPVKWDKDGWPVVGDNGRVYLEMETDCLPLDPQKSIETRDDFDSKSLGIDWNFLRNPKEEDWPLSERPGFIRLTGSAVTLDDFDSPAFIGRRQRHFNCRVQASLSFSPENENEEAGLTVFMNERHHYEIAVTRLAKERRVIVRKRIGGLSAIVASEKIGEGAVTLGLSANKDLYQFFYLHKDSGNSVLAEGETRYLSSEVAGGWTGVFFAMYATGNGKKSKSPAYFDWFEYLPMDGG